MLDKPKRRPPQVYRPVINEVQAWILSYMVGLAPLGEEFIIPRRWVVDDLEGMEQQTLHWHIMKLVQVGAVYRIKGKGRKSNPVFIVLKRPEDFEVRETWLSNQRVFGRAA